MRRIIRTLAFVTFIAAVSLTGSLDQSGTLAQSGRPKKPFILDQPLRRPITISNPSIVTTTTEAQGPQERRNIGNFFAKIRGSRAITVAYLGGSITAGAGASDAGKTSWRAQVTDWLRGANPGIEITDLNAGIANTGSLYGTMRARRDVIAFKPDLVFVEFAVDDVNEEEMAVKKALEGLVRQLLIVPQPPEVVLLYAAAPKRNARIEWHEAIAAHYSLPSINLEKKVWSRIDSDQIKPQDFWARGINPSDLGHRLYADSIIEFLETHSKLEPTPIERNLPLPLISDELNYGEFKAVAEIWHDQSWRIETSADRRLPAKLLSSGKPGSQIEYYFEGTVLGLSYLKAPDGGIVEILIDGKPAPTPLQKIDLYSARRQFGTSILAGGLGPGEHKLTIRVAGEKNPRSSGFSVRLGYLLIGGQRPERL
ncbi:MAG: hypothetical protein IPM66_07515 [Acidobacteriota bacterium]|nr:MAG: hypothetical protein IPM66_07515 [Acidobacteriota bacterium]